VPRTLYSRHVLLISRTECLFYAVLLTRDRDTQRVYRLYDFSKAQLIRPGVAYCVPGKVNSAEKALSRDRVGSPGHETPPGFHCSCSC
jgi:hypothetical protein